MSAQGAAVARVVSALRDKGRHVEQRDAGSYMAQCPAEGHDDRKASLSVAEGDVGAVVYCQAGCETRDVLAALGLTWPDIFEQPRQAKDRAPRRVVAQYRYTDEAGELLFVKLRYEPKDFGLRRPNGRGGWEYKLGDVRRVLYRLPEVIAAVEAGRPVYVVEGEKDADRLAAEGRTATCNFDGAAKDGQRPKWRPEYGDTLRGADVVIVADRDAPGIAHARAAAADLAGKAKSVVIALPSVDRKHADVSDHLDAGHNLDQLVPLPEDASARGAAKPAAKSEGGDGEEGRGPSQATKLRQLAHERFRLLCGDDGKPYAVAKDGPNIVRPLRGKTGLRNLLSKMYADAFGSVPSQSALTDACTALEGDAESAEVEPVYLRVAPHEGGVVLDLGTPDGRCVVVTPGRGWDRKPVSPVLFRRTKLIGPLPDPLNGGTLDAFRKLFNVDDYQWPLIVGWLTAALIPNIPHPILAILGEQGTAKSSAAKLLMMLIDASGAPLRTQPRDLKSWATQAAASWTVCLDNVSTIQPWLSDALCRAATGDGLVDRALYSDDDVNVLSFRRAVALTAIGTGALRGDLAERLVPVDLARIGGDSRRAEEEVMRLYEDARPQALGALLTLLTGVLGELPGVRLDSMPRMADFARVLAALDKVTGWKSLTAYEGTAEELAESVIESDHFAERVRAFMDGMPGPQQGMVGDLLRRITPDKPPKSWPTTPQGARDELRRVAPALRMSGYTIEPLKRTAKGRPWLLAPPEPGSKKESKGNQSSSSSSSSLDGGDLRKLDDDASDDAVTMHLEPDQSSLTSSLAENGPHLRKRATGDDRDDDDDRIRQLSPPPDDAEFWAGEEWSA